MDILKFLCVLFLLCIGFCSAIKTIKHNQTIHTEMPKNISKTMHFIEDDVEAKPQFDKINKKIDEAGVKIELTPTLNTSAESFAKVLTGPLSEYKGVKSIPIPIDLLLKHPKIMNLSINEHNMRNLTRNNESNNLNNTKPKTSFCEDTLKAVDDEVSDFYNKIILMIEKPSKVLENKLEDIEDFAEIKMRNDDVDYYKKPIKDSNASLAEPLKESCKINYSTVKNETLKEQTAIPTTIEIIINNDLSNRKAESRPKSTITIHNRCHQKIIQPMNNYVPRSYYYPYNYPLQSSYSTYKPYLCGRYTDPYRFYNIGSYYKPTAVCSNDMKSNIVWKAWNNMDTDVNNSADVNLNYDTISDALDLDELKPKHKHIENENNVYDVRNVHYNYK